MDTNYPTAPELPGKHGGSDSGETKIPVETAKSGTKIQLIESTKPKPADVPAEPEPDDDEFVALEDDDELNEHVEEPGDPDGVVAQDKIREWQQAHPLPTAVPKKRKPFWLKALLTLLIIAVLAAGAWWYGNKRASAPAPKPVTRAKQTQSQVVAPETTATKHYNSSIYTLEFDYPANWTISDTAAKLTVTSPTVQLTGADGQKTDGQVIVTIQNQQTSIAGYPAQGATAALASDKLTYKSPTPIQRAQTYVSYVGYTAGSLDGIFVTGDNGYQLNQLVPMSDIAKGNPLIDVTFMRCGTAGCATGGTALSLAPSSWPGSTIAKDITNLIESLQLD